MNLKPALFELSISRAIDAPCQKIFRAWTEPAESLYRLETLVTQGMPD